MNGFLRSQCICMLRFGMQVILMKGGGLGSMRGVMHLMFASIRMFMFQLRLPLMVDLEVSLGIWGYLILVSFMFESVNKIVWGFGLI